MTDTSKERVAEVADLLDEVAWDIAAKGHAGIAAAVKTAGAQAAALLEALASERDSRTPKVVIPGSHVIAAQIYKRGSTDEWVLELTGAIGDTDFHCRHTAPASTRVEDVAGLDHLYTERDALKAAVERDGRIIRNQGMEINGLKSRAEAAEAERDALREKVEVLESAAQCGCGYDAPGEVCLHHCRIRDEAHARGLAEGLEQADAAIAHEIAGQNEEQRKYRSSGDTMQAYAAGEAILALCAVRAAIRQAKEQGK